MTEPAHPATESAQAAVTRCYDRIARGYDLFERPMELMIGRRRRRLLAKASGTTLEVGAGTGRNFGLYPTGVDIMGIDISAKMLERAHRNTAKQGLDVELHVADVQHLPFEGDSFDTVTATSVFCSLDMGADASVYALSLAAVGSTSARKNRLARTSGYLQFALAAVGLVEVLRRFIADDELPDTTSMIVVSLLALAGNIVTLIVLRRVRTGEVHFQASGIFTANDIKVNALVITAAIAVSITDTATPDLVAAAVIFLVVANGARRILRISR